MELIQFDGNAFFGVLRSLWLVLKWTPIIGPPATSALDSSVAILVFDFEQQANGNLNFTITFNPKSLICRPLCPTIACRRVTNNIPRRHQDHLLFSANLKGWIRVVAVSRFDFQLNDAQFQTRTTIKWGKEL
jgi:hypothetical protein